MGVRLSLLLILRGGTRQAQHQIAHNETKKGAGAYTMSQENSYVLEMRDVVKIFPGVRALDGVTLRVRPGTVHVIVGENGAGKSTLMKIITGSYVADGGEMFYKGQPVGKRSIMETLDMGISMIAQELNPVEIMTIAENIFLGREPRLTKGVVDDAKMNSETQRILDDMKIPYQAKQPLNQLSVSGQQLVEIAKAVSRNASLVIMDEPTSSITDKEVDLLFEQINKLRARGVGIIYITHKMDEVFQIADDITVIRDGKGIETGPAANFTIDKLITLMVGREINDLYPENQAAKGDVVLDVRNLTKKGKYHDVSFTLRRGEILGFSGLVGAGRSEVMRAVFGLEPADSGEIWVKGKKLSIRDTTDAIKYGIGMVTEDRRGEGIIPAATVKENASIASIRKYLRGMFIDEKREMAAAKASVDSMSARYATMDQQIQYLSGGNQQKIILSRLMLLDLDVLILDEPARGIDVGAKREIHQLMVDFAKKGYGIIMISSEMPEIIGMSDRVIVMHEGVTTGELARGEVTQESIMRLAVASTPA